MSGNFLSCLKGVRREGGISLVMPQGKNASSPIEGRISWFFSSCSSKLGVLPLLIWGPQGSSCGGLRNVQSPCKVRGASQDSSAVNAGAEVLIWS